MKKYITTIFTFLLLGFTAKCAMAEGINLQSFQTQISQNPNSVYSRTVNIPEKTVMKDILNTLQNEGYMVNSISPKYGFVSASKEINMSDKSINFAEEFDTNKFMMFLKWVKICVFEMNINVSQEAEGCTVKVSMKKKLLNTYGNTVYTKNAENAFYNSFFSKLNYTLNN